MVDSAEQSAMAKSRPLSSENTAELASTPVEESVSNSAQLFSIAQMLLAILALHFLYPLASQSISTRRQFRPRTERDFTPTFLVDHPYQALEGQTMPELPEVETYVRELEPELAGRSVTSAVVHWPKIIAEPSVEAFQQGIAGQRFVSFGRRGKFMLLGLEGGDSLIVHLRMTGKLLIQPPDTHPDKHTHVVLMLDDGRQLHYNDARKFGRLWLGPRHRTGLAETGS